VNNLHIYALILTPTTKLFLPQGIFQQVKIINSDRLSAIIESDINLELIKEDDQKLIDAVLCHDRVICEIFAQTTVLPLRFGIAFASETTLISHLTNYYDDYLAKLQELINKAEYTLKFTALAPPELDLPQENSGRGYFLAKKQKYQKQQEFYENQEKQWENVVKLINDHYPCIAQGEGEQRKILLLTDKNIENLLLTQLENWQIICENWEINMTVGLPPYHFS
jgi:Gas vesicle synthesis protein GvpL/GvpF